MKKRKIAFPKDVKITRDGIYAHIDFIDPSYMSRRIEIGSTLSSMTDAEILRIHNDIVFSEQASIRQSRPTEIEDGGVQIRFDKASGSWVPESDVLRCELTSGEEPHDLVVRIDDQDLSWAQFGRMVSSYRGWGMRVTFLPEEQLFKPPATEIIEKSPKAK
jgi:hypothetical protein